MISHVGICDNHIPGWRTSKAKNLRQDPILTMSSPMWLVLAQGTLTNMVASRGLQSMCVSSSPLKWLGVFSFSSLPACHENMPRLTYFRCVRNMWRRAKIILNQLTASQLPDMRECSAKISWSEHFWLKTCKWLQLRPGEPPHWPTDFWAIIYGCCFKPHGLGMISYAASV